MIVIPYGSGRMTVYILRDRRVGLTSPMLVSAPNAVVTMVEFGCLLRLFVKPLDA